MTGIEQLQATATVNCDFAELIAGGRLRDDRLFPAIRGRQSPGY